MSLTNALVALIRSHPARATPLAPALLALELPEDLRTLVDAWVHHRRPSQNSLAAWSLLDV